MKSEATAISAENARSWTQVLAPYRQSKDSRGILELLITALPFALLWTLMWMALAVSLWLCILLAVPTASFLLRLFMIQHDCGHGAFFRQRLTNDWVGRIIGVVTLTPYDFWRRTHAMHHATSGNLDRRGMGDIDTLTTDEYLARSWLGRFVYRVYRNPVVMFGIGPAYLFLVQHRVPAGLMRAGAKPWFSTMGTNAGIAAVAGLLVWLVGIGPFLLVQLPVVLIAASTGVWLFYVQHQFEHTTWAHDDDWNMHHAALHGSSYYELPRVLRWLTANIGVHHVHHLSSRIPFYRLRKVLADHPELANVGRLTLGESLRGVGLTLWDERQGRLISFRELRLRGADGGRQSA